MIKWAGRAIAAWLTSRADLIAENLCLQGELARLGFTVSARTVATYMRRPYDGVPSPSWREFLTRHAKDIWACDFFCVRTIFFQALDVFFVMHHETRQIVQARVTRHSTAEWAAQQIVDACGWDRDPPRYLICDRDGRFGIEFDRRVQRLGVKRIRTPVRAPRANALAERWVRSARTECLDHLLIVNEHHLQRVLDEYVVYFNAWRPHRGLGQRAPCGSSPTAPANPTGRIVGRPVLGGLHHVYQHAA